MNTPSNITLMRTMYKPALLDQLFSILVQHICLVCQVVWRSLQFLYSNN